MVKKMVYLEAPQERVLKELASRENVSETDVMRRALDLYARTHLADPLDDLLGTLQGGPPDGAREHDRYAGRQRAR